MTDPVAPRPPSGLKAVGWAVLFLVFGFGLTIGLATGLVAMTGGLATFTASEAEHSPRLLLIQSVATIAGFAFATWLIGVRANRLSLTDLRWKPVEGAGTGAGLALLLGGAAALSAVLLSLPLGGARFLPDSGGIADYLRQAGLTILILIPAALGEEMAFRGTAQVLLARVFGRWSSIVALSVLFGLAHLFNPNPTALAISNITLAGLFLGAVFYMQGGIWAAWAAHLGWNATLALLDAPVSGLPFTIPLINYDPGGPQWLTGGGFGPEGGALASVAIIVATVVAWRGSKEAA